MRLQFFILLTTFTASCTRVVWGPRRVNATVGESVTVPCSYNTKYRAYGKFWCRARVCTQVSSTQGTVTDARVTLRDHVDQETLYVTVSGVSREDEDWYTCGVSGTVRLDNKHSVYLHVTHALSPQTTSSLGFVISTHNVPHVTTEAQPHQHSTTHLKQASQVWAILRWFLLVTILVCSGTVNWWRRSRTQQDSHIPDMHSNVYQCLSRV